MAGYGEEEGGNPRLLGVREKAILEKMDWCVFLASILHISPPETGRMPVSEMLYMGLLW